MPILLGQLADQLGAEVDRVPLDLMIHGVSSIPGAREGCLVFAEDETSLAAALASAAAAVLVGRSISSTAAGKPLKLDMLPWEGMTLNYAVLGLGIVGLITIFLAVTGWIRFLFLRLQWKA